MKIDPKWNNTEKLLSHFIQMHRDRGGVPQTSVNWASENSDISFIWRYNFMALHNLWTVTDGDRALQWLIDAVEWALSMTDEALPADYSANVIVDWHPKTIKRMSLPQTGYARSPHKEMGPGWCRFIDIGNGKKGFRPEVLASGTIGLAVAMFTRDAGDVLCNDRRERWLEHLARLFEWHAPSWQDDHTHPDGDHFGKPHNGLKVAAYCWPKGIGPDPDGNIPGLNQQVQFLTMGLLVEEMLGRDIGAKTKLQMFCDKTLPQLLKEDDQGRLFTAYDLRAHSEMPPHKAEPTNDGNHWNKSAVLFIEAARVGILPVELQDKLIKTILEVTHLGDGEMAILQDGSSEHDGGNRQKNPGIEHVVGALMFENGHQLLELAETCLAREMPNPGGHKSMAYYAQFLRAKAFHSITAHGTYCGAVNITPVRKEPVADQKPVRKPAKAEKKQTTKKPKANTPQPGTGNTVITQPMVFASYGKPQAIPESVGSKGAHVRSMGDKHVVNNPSNWDDEKKKDAIMLNPIAKGESTVVWYIGAKRYETRVTVS